jgi:hypothetical protein
MPYKFYDSVCKNCGVDGALFREKFSKQNNKFYKQPNCKDCDFKKHKSWVNTNRQRVRELCMSSYFKRTGGRKRRSSSQMTDELRKQYALEKSQMRATRAKQARVQWDRELTSFVMQEAIDLQKRLYLLTGIKHHIDHVVPLRGKNVCGLHVWNNLAVIPMTDNLKKGNNFAIHA